MIDRLRAWAFEPPYRGVPWLAWLYAFIACMACTQGGVFTGHLVGIDDHARMAQVLEWINGAGWYDHTLHRADPPDGFTTIWARIVDVPIAAVILLAQQFTDQKTAALIASVAVPYAQLALLFMAARYFARPVVGRRKARLVVLFIMFTTVLNYHYFTISGFHPGEASHRSWYIILDLVLLGAAGRIALGAAGPSSSYVMAASAALLLAIGIEGLPVIAAACTILAGLAWYFRRPPIAARTAQAMALGAIGTFLLLPLYQPPEKLFDVSYVEPSILGPILMAAAALFLALEFLAINGIRNKGLSFIFIVLAAAAIGAALIAAFPKILEGATAGLSPAERIMALKEQYEMRPLYEVAKNRLDLLGMLAPTLIALGAAVFAIRQAPTKRRRAMCIAYAGFAVFAGGMTEIYARYIHHAETTACVWLLWAWEKIKARLPRNRFYPAVAFAVFVTLGPLWLLLIPAFQGNGPLLSEIFLYPAKLQTKRHNCDPVYLAHYLNVHYGKDTVLNVPTWDGTMFLYYSDLKIDFIGLFPSHDKFIDNQNFFVTKDPDMAKDIARRHGFDLVAVCTVPSVINPQVPLDRQILMGLLQIDRPPKWLKYVDTREPGNYVLYEVDKAALAK